MTKIPSDVQNSIRIVRHGNSSKDIDVQLSEVEDDGEQGHKSETSITKFSTPETTELKQEQWLRVAGDQVVLKKEKELASSGKQTVSVREETNAVSDTRVMIVQNRHQKPLHPPSHQHQEVEVRLEKGASEAEAGLGSPTDSLQKLLERYLQ